MNIHLKIKEYVNKKGAEIIVSNTLIGMLDDELVFDDVEAFPYKKILRNIIKEGYAKKLLDLGSYTPDVNFLASQYANKNLMQEPPVLYVLDCLAYGLGWTDKEPTIQVATTPPQAPTTNTQVTQPTSAPLLEETGDNLLEENSNTAESEKTARQKQLMEQLQKELEAAKKQREKMERRTQELEAERTSFNPTRPIPNSTRTTSTHVKTPWYKQWYTWISAAVFAGLLYIGFANSDSNTDDGDAVRTEMVVSTAINRLEGNYTLRKKNAGVSVNGIRTAAIKKTSESQAKILVSTEYGPELYDFTLNTSGQIESEQLGKGEITYNEKLDKITLTFKQGERICEFTK